MTLIYATSNGAKLKAMRNITDGIGIELIGLGDIGSKLPKLPEPLDIDENGADPLENAKIKALGYYKALKHPLFSCDSGLYLDGMPPELQPGVHVRNVGGKRLSDDEMIDYYSGLAHKAGGQITAHYLNGICLVLSENKIYTHSGEDISYNKFIISDTPHKKRNAGFPLDCLSIHIETGRYYYDLEGNYELERKSDNGFRDFFWRSLKEWENSNRHNSPSVK